MNEKILIIEDEEKIARFVELELSTRAMRFQRPTTDGMVSSWRKKKAGILYSWM